MAQWSGQFSGLTHESKLADAEDALRVAIAVFRIVPTDAAKAKAVRRLATRVLNLRLKLLKVRRIAKGPVDSASIRAEQLQARERTVSAAGVRGILAEFSATDALDFM